MQHQLRRAREELEQRVLERTEELRQQIEKRTQEQEQREARAARVERQHAAIVELSLEESLFQGRVTEAARIVTETMVRVLGVARASIWLQEQGKDCLRTVDLFESETGSHSAGDELAIQDYPA